MSSSATTNERVRLNIGGKVFETTVSTLCSGGSDSLLSVLSSRLSTDSNPIFIDRDPEIFSILLSLLRSGHLPSIARRFSNQELAEEALYYGIETRLKSALSPPSFKGIDASVVATIKPASDAFPSAFTANVGEGSVWVAHGGQISGYDWNLTHTGTIRTHMENITSIRRVWAEVAAVGSTSVAGLHFYDFAGGRHVASAHWLDPSDPRIYKARVHCIADSESSVYGSFECGHKENCILVVDKETIKVVSEIGRQNGASVKTSAASKMTYLPDPGVIVSSSVTSGAFGYSGYIRLWDPRSGELVWETNEPGSGRSSRFGDSFADMDVDVEQKALFKVCSKSGDLAFADLRNLKEDPWVYLKDKNPSLRNMGGSSNIVLHCYNKQVFLGRGGGLEVWSRVEEEERGGGGGVVERMIIDEGSYRRNYVDKEVHEEKGIIKRIEGGGDRLFVSREGVEGIEVWESSNLSGSIPVL
ncbi:unnamed protein product [Rhodiola kirilowii]